jgi:hypothetical protein
MRPDPFAQHVEPGKHAHGSGGSRRRPERLVLPVQQTSLLVPSSGLLLCPDPEAIRRPQVAAALEEEHVFDADSAAAGLPLFDVPEAGTASDGSRVMIAPQRGSARMPVSHQEQGCRTRCLSVLQLANLGHRVWGPPASARLEAEAPLTELRTLVWDEEEPRRRHRPSRDWSRH